MLKSHLNEKNKLMVKLHVGHISTYRNLDLLIAA